MISKPKDTFQRDLFKVALEDLLNSKEPLYKLANQIDWSIFEKEFGPTYCPNRGRPGMPIRKMVGLHYLKAVIWRKRRVCSGEMEAESLLAVFLW